MTSGSYLSGSFGQYCGARLSGGRGYCRAWALQGKRRCKWHGGKSTGPRTPEGMARTAEAMRWGRFRKIEYLHASGRKAPGGRPGRISYRLRRAVIEAAETELAGLDPEAIRMATPSVDEMSEAEQLADLDRYGVVLLLDELRLPVGSKNRNRAAIRLAWNLAEIRYERVERGDKQRSRLDELIEEVALS
jgi:hypothetical protein